jgi:hypothetical protein
LNFLNHPQVILRKKTELNKALASEKATNKLANNSTLKKTRTILESKYSIAYFLMMCRFSIYSYSCKLAFILIVYLKILLTKNVETWTQNHRHRNQIPKRSGKYPQILGRRQKVHKDNSENAKRQKPQEKRI